jgi:hypothetical protein
MSFGFGHRFSLALLWWLAATLYRLNRCGQNDVWYMQTLLNVFSSQPSPACLVGYFRPLFFAPTPAVYLPFVSVCRLDSQLLQNNIGSSELFDGSRPLAALQEQVAQAMFASDLSIPFYTNLHNYSFPLYTPDPRTFNSTLNAPQLPVLLLNGDLDPQTPGWYANYTTADLQVRSTAHLSLALCPCLLLAVCGIAGSHSVCTAGHIPGRGARHNPALTRH